MEIKYKTILYYFVIINIYIQVCIKIFNSSLGIICQLLGTIPKKIREFVLFHLNYIEFNENGSLFIDVPILNY